VTDDGTRRRRSKQRFEKLNEFVDSGIIAASLSPAEIATWIVLFRHDRDHKVCISVPTIERSTGLCKSTVLRSLKELKAKRMLFVVKRGGIGRGPSQYLLTPSPRPPRGAK
jgi:hypothetical protein